MSGLLKGEMGFIMSNWADPKGIADIAPDNTCSATGNTCTSGSVFSAFAVKSSGSAEDPAGDNTDPVIDPTDPVIDPVDPVIDPTEPGELVTEVASSVSLCGADCADCEASYFENLPTDITYTCNSEKLYQYTNQCGDSMDQSLCGADDKCLYSYPWGDRRRYRSREAGCRPVPDRLINNDMQFYRNKCKSNAYGLCAFGCIYDQKCRLSMVKGARKKY